MNQYNLLLIIVFFGFQALNAQKISDRAIKQQLESYKTDPRGPYKDIRWFCPDGTINMPREPCEKTGGVQRARYKDAVDELAKTNHIFLGQILANTDFGEFWDAENYNSRLKQFQLEKYLRSVDDGWVLQKGQYYRGAFQVEYEEAWGIDFFDDLLKKRNLSETQFYLLRQAAKDVPHQGDDNKTIAVRTVSQTIAEAYPKFMPLRIKIHGQPETADIQRVIEFRNEHRMNLTSDLLRKMEQLVTDMRDAYGPVNLSELNKFLKKVPKNEKVYRAISGFISSYEKSSPEGFVKGSAEILETIREGFPEVGSRSARLALLDISNSIEEIFFSEVIKWKPQTVRDACEKICYSGTAAYGTGLIEKNEWNELITTLALPMKARPTLGEMNDYLSRSRALVEWGTGMIQGVYKDVVKLYGEFEPMSYGFFDDRVRGSVLLNLGQTIGELGDFLAKESNFSNELFNIKNQNNARGLNPGFAMSELVVVTGNSDIEVSKDKIYIFNNPPSDLKPVAGIATVTEGNMVSHVQLLARNLGIPNAVISSQNLSDIKKFSGEKVFYAVSNKGTIILKKADKMTDTERKLFEKKERSEDMVEVPIGQIDLNQKKVLDMRSVNASNSGKICGPKAANLGELKQLFPENVVEGLVLPFGIFREHMEQQMPGQSQSYWLFLNRAFETAATKKQKGESEQEIEKFMLNKLAVLRDAIKKMELLPSFEKDFETQFRKIFSKPLGNVPVFVRSDTNMEDLKDFTGAGLNLTLFNIKSRNDIIQGIKDVWASPYTERSFKWRQRYLLNPENVFPSILIIPSVDVDYSGVMITKGITTGSGADLTVAFSRGAGGAVDGQAAESYLLPAGKSRVLLSPARESSYRRLPTSGGTSSNVANFNDLILNPQNIYDLRKMAYEMHQKLPKPKGMSHLGPLDIELGFSDDKMWLFQVRPFVENKSALNSEYLESITPRVDDSKKVNLSAKV